MTPDTLDAEADLLFPSSDGKPMSENTRQYEAIVALKGNIEAFVPADTFVAGDHLIYVDPTIRADSPDRTDRQAPDVYVAFGRPRGHRSSYRVWEEEDIFPQVIFEVLAPSNTDDEMQTKREFYFRYGAEEYYEFDPEAGTWTGFVRDAATGQPVRIEEMDGHISPRLGMRFAFQPMELRVFRPDGTPFLSFEEMERDRVAQRQRADEEHRQRVATQKQVDEERQRADEERRQGDVARQEAERLRALLRAAGIDPDANT